eukprot:TRINITY_DN2209_c0_g1_i8.p1 TRINITY_DN2209_c0_g1~~TRINITY_DN2209_c0_g1_i8.p1  ORF type:complete len:597 (+),score=149.84 TRINITY_DN2209_c0_g1_i8:183-1973(+)
MNSSELFPAFGNAPSVPIAPTTAMDFGSAWASSRAPEQMPEVVSRRPRRQTASAQAPTPSTQDGAAPSTTSVPWRESDWGSPSIARWSGSEPCGWRGTEVEDPYAQTLTGKPKLMRKTPVAPAKVVEPVVEPVVERVVEKRSTVVQDEDGFTQVAVRSRPKKGAKASNSNSSGPLLMKSDSAFEALMGEQDSFSPSPKPAAKPSQPAPNQDKSQQRKKGKGKKSVANPEKSVANSEKKPKSEKSPPTQVVGSGKKKQGSSKSGKGKPHATPNPGPTLGSPGQLRGVLFGCLLALQYGMQPLLTKECIGDKVNKSSIVVVQEVSKFAIAGTLMAMELGTAGFKEALYGKPGSKGKPGTPPWTLKSSLMVALVPSAIYAVQNYCLFYAAGNMDPLTFNLVNQTKMIWTALFVYLVLARPQSNIQMVAICLLMAAAVTLTSTPEAADAAVPTSFWHGIVPNLVAALLSGLAAALSQYALQKLNRSSYVFTMELCIYQLGWFVCKEQGGMLAGSHFFQGWDAYTILPIVNNALGGIFTGQVVKYAGAVKKTFAVIAALVLTSVFRYLYYENAPLSDQMYIALPLMLVANYLHASYPPAKK